MTLTLGLGEVDTAMTAPGYYLVDTDAAATLTATEDLPNLGTGAGDSADD